MSITLYALDGCPWCEKVHDALEEHDIEYDTIWVEALHSERDEVARGLAASAALQVKQAISNNVRPTGK